MVTLIKQLAAALGLTAACALLHAWWLAGGGVAPLPFELWLTVLPGFAVRALLPGAGAGLAVTLAVLALQHLAVVLVLAAGAARLRPARRAQSSSPASSPGNSTSVKPNWLKSRTRIG